MGCLVVFEPGLVEQNTSFWRKLKEKKVFYSTMLLKLWCYCRGMGCNRNINTNSKIDKDFEEEIYTCNKIFNDVFMK